MAGDFNKPALTDNYTAFASAVRDLCADIAKGLDPALSLGTSNTPTNTIRWNSANGYWEKYNGTSWAALASTYNIRSATSDKWHTARSASWSGDLTGTASASIDGSANITLAATLATVNSSTGTFGSTSEVPVVTVNGKGLVTAVTTASLGSLAVQNSNAVGVTGGSISGTTIVLSNSPTAAPTTDAQIEWDSDSEEIKVGTGSGTATFTPKDGVATLTNKTMGSGSTWNGNAVAVVYGGTGATDAATARTNLGITSLATQAASAVSITGGTISGTTIILKNSSSAAPTTEGAVEWDSDDDLLSIGNGSGTKQFAPLAPTNQVTQTNLTLSTNCTWNGTSIPVLYGGTGASSASGALSNLLPAGAVSGYVLKTTGPGGYYWAAESGAATNFGTTINSTRSTFTATGGQTVFSGLGTYVIGTNQVRVYVNGVRLYSSDYTETSTTSVTLTQACVAGDSVMIEVDGYISYNPTALDISLAAAGNISSTNVRDALYELDTDKSATTHTHTASVITSTAVGNITATNVQAALQELDTEKAQISSSTGAVYVPSGTTAQQPGSPVVGMLRFNSQINSFEGYNNGLAWGSIGGGAKGGGTDDVFYENGQTVNTSYTLTTNKNAMSAGPITIANGVTVTVPNNSIWTIV